MNKYIVISLICLSCLLTACGFNRLYERRNNQTASGSAVSSGGISSVNKEIEKEMQTADYWIGKTVSPDKILMSGEDITKFNQKITEQLSTNPEAGYYNLSTYGESIDGKLLSDMITRIDFQAKTYYLGEQPVTANQWKTYYNNRNIEKIGNFNTISYGIICSRADVRELPTSDEIMSEHGEKGHDVLQNTALPVNEPVLVLLTNKDENWYYIIANEYAGWIKKETVGLCENKAEWEAARQMKDFLIVTGDRVQTEENIVETGKTANGEFTMGTKLALAEEKECKEVFGREEISHSYVVRIPVRTEDGKLDYQLSLIPKGRDVHEGYLEYTRANVLRQSFKMLGNQYGWGGINGYRDCSSMIRDVYLCFGVRLPRNSSAQAMIPGESRLDISKLSDEEKIQKLNSIEPGTILQMSGHVMIYLGCVEQNYYVISANGSLVPGYVMLNDLNEKSPGTDKTWLNRLEIIVGIP
ncbi:MAG: SH3 domain-containing protein [Lachnospiraceae bacterium]|nr:SH3 domain-containing protein [Lachnospiraceae bacterium]